MTDKHEASGVGVDPRTGRLLGDHGTAEDAIRYIFEGNNPDMSLQEREFLTAWAHGDLDEWPEYYEWLADRTPPASAEQANGDKALMREGAVGERRIVVAKALARHPDSSWDDYEWEDMSSHVRELFLEQADLAIAAIPTPTPVEEREKVEALAALVRYHESGGHEGDGSDENLALAKAELAALQHAQPTPEAGKKEDDA